MRDDPKTAIDYGSEVERRDRAVVDHYDLEVDTFLSER
jgi:hypothetical protein